MEDYDKEYIEYLMSFSTERNIEKEEQDSLEFEEAIHLNDIIIDMIFINDHFYTIGKLTQKGKEKIPVTWFDKCIDFLNNY